MFSSHLVYTALDQQKLGLIKCSLCFVISTCRIVFTCCQPVNSNRFSFIKESGAEFNGAHPDLR